MAKPNSIRGRTALSGAANIFVGRLDYQVANEVLTIACLIAHDEGRQTTTIGDVLHAFSSWNNGVTRLDSWAGLVEYAEAKREDFGGISVG